MTISSDPAVHRQREQELVQHVLKLLSDDRLRVDTSAGARSITTLIRDVVRSDRATDLKRTMSEMGLPDRALQAKMPIGESIDATLGQKRFLFFRKVVGRLRVICVSPTRSLLKGEMPEQMSAAEVQKLLASAPPSIGSEPQTLVLMSTSGFTLEAHALADRGAGRSVVMVEPNGGGGWTVTGPPEARSITELFDPEQDADKRQRARLAIEESRLDLLQGGMSVEKLASRTRLPAGLVETEMKAYARANPGLVAKKLDGRLVLFREGSMSAGAGARPAAGGSSMPLIDRMKALFGRKGDDEKKIAFLSERRAALSQQRDLAYDDMGALEQQEAALVRQFKESPGTITKKRVTSQLLQLRKDLERRQQLLGVLNQQINVVSTHLHNLELVQQGQSAHLPDTEEMTADAVKAEEMLAELEANSELSTSVAMSAGASGLSAEEQALYEELEAEHKAEKTAPDAAAPAPASKTGAAAAETRPRASSASSASNVPPPLPSSARRSEPEAG